MSSPLQILDMQYQPAPNQWGDKDLVCLTVDLGPLEQLPTRKIPGFPSRLLDVIPSLHTHRCSYGTEGGFVRRMTEDEGTWMGHVLEHVAIELQCLWGHDVSYGRTRGAGAEGVYNVWFECLDPAVGFRAGLTAHALLLRLIGPLPSRVASRWVERLSDRP